MSVTDELEALHGVSLADFLEARKQHAGALRKAGDKEGAARIGACPKPTPAAWAVNQLWRTKRAEVEALLTLGADLREALRRSLAGSGDARAMGALQQRQRAAIEPLAAEARRLLGGAGAPASDVVLERVATTLGAISTTGAWGEAAPGQLGKELGAPDLATIAAMFEKAPGPREPTEEAPFAPGPGRSRHRAAAPSAGAADVAAADVVAAERQREEERLSRALIAEAALREARDREGAAADAARAAAEALAEAVAERRALSAELATATSRAGDKAREAEEARHRAEEARREVDALTLRSAASARTEAGAAEQQERAEAEAKEATRAREAAEAALGALAARG